MAGGGAPLQPDLVDKIDKALAGGGAVHRLRPHRDPRHRHRQRCPASTSPSRLSCGPVVPTLDAKLVDDDGDELPRRPRRGRRAVRARPGRDQGLPQPARGDGGGDPRRLVPHRRHRPHRRRRLRLHRRPGQGHGAARRRERLLRRGRGGDLRARRRRRGRRVRACPTSASARRSAPPIVLRAGVDARPRTSCATFLGGDASPSTRSRATIWFRDQPLPRNANGKFLKRELRDELADT